MRHAPGRESDTVLRPLTEGRYVDFLPVGQGGMGIVYWALDTDLKRQVAFKVIRPPAEHRGHEVTPPVPQALATPGETDAEADDFRVMTARFLQEAWITGAMEHPGIVPIYELGCTDAGVPYYTMKFIRDSRTLATAFEEATGLEFEERLALLEPFLKVCDTIRYAHRQGVIHRDLKPENIAIGEFGEVLVLDWGLAKLIGAAQEGGTGWQESVETLREASGLLTLAGAVGTPGYMAPEAVQGQGALVSERCDVYSLGAILHELLTRRLPFEFQSVREYLDQLKGGVAPDPREHEPSMPETLAAICQRALRPDPSARTATVDDLAGEIRTWQARRAIEQELTILLADADRRLRDAGELGGDAALKQLDSAALAVRRALELDPDHSGAAARLARVEAARGQAILERERLARMRVLRRAGAAVLVVATVAAILVAGVLDKARQRAEDAREDAASARGRAEADRARAETVMGFMVGEMQESLQPLGRLDLLAGLGRKAKAYYDGLPATERHPDSLRNGTLALRKLGDVYNEQGDLPAAHSAYEASVALAQGLPADDTGEAGYLLTQARAKLCGVLIAQGYPARAVTRLQTHLADIRARSRRHPQSDEYRALLAEAYDLLCRAHTGTLEIDQALASSDEALRIAEALAQSDDKAGGRHRALVRYLLTPARGLRMRGKTKAGLARAQRALELASSWRQRRPGDMRWARLEADAAYLHAYFLEASGAYDEAIELYEKGRLGYELLVTLDPGNMAVLHRLSQVLHRSGRSLLLRERAGSGASEGEITIHHEPWERAYGIQRALVRKDPSNAYWLHSMIGHCDRMSTIVKAKAVHEGRPDGDAQAEAFREQALRWARRLMDCDKENVLWQHLYAYTLFQRAVSRLKDDPKRAHARLKEVIRLCEDLARRHPGGLAELAVLGWWAVQAFCREVSPPRPDRIRMMRGALEALDRAHAQQNKNMDVEGVRLEAGAALASALTAGTTAERAEAVDLARAGTQQAHALLDREPPIAENDRRSLETSLASFEAVLRQQKPASEAPR